MTTGWADLEAAAKAGDTSKATEIVMAFPPMLPLQDRPALHREISTMVQEHRWAEDHLWSSVEFDKLDPPANQRLSEIAAPTLVVSGSLDDDAFLQLGDQMVREMPNADRLVIEGGSHMVNMEVAAEFNDAVLGWIRRTSLAVFPTRTLGAD